MYTPHTHTSYLPYTSVPSLLEKEQPLVVDAAITFKISSIKEMKQAQGRLAVLLVALVFIGRGAECFRQNGSRTTIPKNALFLRNPRIPSLWQSVDANRYLKKSCGSRVCLRSSFFDENNRDFVPRSNAQNNDQKNRSDPFQDLALIKAKLGLSEDLVPLELLGKASLPTTTSSSFLDQNQNQTCVVLSPPTQQPQQQQQRQLEQRLPALLVPLDNSNQLRLVEAAAAGAANPSQIFVSNTVLLRLNTLVVNRDGGLFDNLPWASWTVDPSLRNRDAAGNAVNAKFHFGKRDAYNVLLGKDWRGGQGGRGGGSSSMALVNLAQRLRNRMQQQQQQYQQENVGQEEASSSSSSVESMLVGEEDNRMEEENERVLARRMLELQIREAQMDVAECDSQLAITANTMDETWALEDEREILASRVASLQSQLQQLVEKQEQSSSSSSTTAALIDQVLANVETVSSLGGGRQEEAPYRGATGYAPKKENGETDATFSSPYDMFREILKDQLNAEVIGTLLENTSLLEGTTALGGLLVLRRLTATKTATIAGETLSVSDETEDFGNAGVRGGELMAVECDADEALGMSLSCGLPLLVEQSIWERASLMVQPKFLDKTSQNLNVWETVDPELSILIEGQASNQSATERVAPLRSPRTITSLFDTLLQAPTGTSDELFPTDNPIQSLAELDRLSNEDKARTLLSMSNFEGRLPRPRVVRESEQAGEGVNALDRLLAPRIDESVRREYYIRQAVNQGDLELAQELSSSKSMRQISKEKAEQAKEAGELEVAAYWEKEAELYASLRADVTQDEGSYSLFLDRDEWYERNRLRTAQRNRKKFGNLLDE